MGQGCAVCLGLKSRDTLEHLKFLEELGNWSRSERNKLLKLYLLMSHLRQVLALIGSFNDLNNDKAEFVHKFVGKETGFHDMKKMKESLINLRKYSSEVGGSLMRASGIESLIDIEELSILGIVEILPKLRRLFKLRNMRGTSRRMAQLVRKWIH